MKCLNVIVFYNNIEEVEEYISEVNSIAQEAVDIAVVVNSDIKHQIDTMTSDLKSKNVDIFRVFDFGENVGYLNSLLKVIQLVDLSMYDYIILSNTDIHYESKDFFSKLINNDYPTDIGCIAPSVYATQNNSFSNPHYLERVPKKKLERLVKIFKHPFVGRCYLALAGVKANKTKKEKQNSCYVYSPHGCYMIFTHEFITRILGYEYGVKLYSEESAVGELLLQKDMKCYYDDSISVVHQESSVTGKMDYKKRFHSWRESLIYILEEFYE